MWTSSWFSSWSAFPHVTVKSFMSFRACRRDSIVSAVIWIITPSTGGEKKEEKKKPRYGYNIFNTATIKSESRRTLTGISLMVCDNFKMTLSSKCKAQEVCIFMWSPSTMLVLAKKPDEVFKAPLNTKKQAPVTARNREKQAGVSGASLPDHRHRSHVSASAPLRGW